MVDLDKEIPFENLTQRDIMQFLLHSTQHVATREELQSAKQEINEKIDKVEESLNKRIDQVEESLNNKIDKVEENLNKRIDKVESKIDKVENKIDKLLWFIVFAIASIFLKDYILSFLSK